MNYTKTDPVECWVTSKKSRLKKYKNNIFYLDNNKEFEIELFNSSSKPRLVKIKIGDNFISTSGLILKPNSRIFLDRYLDSNNKFIFKYLKPEENVSNKLNNIEIFFYEKIEILYNDYRWYPYDPYIPPYQEFPYCGDPINSNINELNSIGNNNTNIKTNLISEINSTNILDLNRGKIDKSDNESNDMFSFDYTSIIFDNDHFAKFDFKLLPNNKKINDFYTKIRIYCMQCGKKAHFNHNFCSKCGTKL